MFRQDYRINPGETKNKDGFTGRARCFSAEAELRFRGFIWPFLKANAATREINQVNPVNPVRKHFGFMSK